MPEEPTLGVKFSRDTLISEYWLIEHNISYEQSDLEDTPYGRCARIKYKEEEKDA